MCQFSVTPEEAKSIALKATTPGRAMPELLWSGLYHRYVWRVEVQPEGVQWIGKCEGCKMAIIDPNTRQVLMAGDWKEGWQ
jgi:hypothetical protein